MKTIYSYLNRNYDHEYYENYDHAAGGDLNRNATVTQAEYQRDACEEELYRLRYGIEKLLANKEQGDFQGRSKNGYIQNPFRTMTNYSNSKIKSWFDRCTPCCRSWRRSRRDDNQNIPNKYAYHHDYNDQNYGSSTSRTPKSPSKKQRDLFNSTSPSPSISSLYKNIKNKLIASKDINDPVYQSLILKILEAKALDCLCTGYSKQNTQKQISQALTEINQRTNDNQEDSTSVTSSGLSSVNYDSLSSPSVSSRSIKSPLSIQTPNQSPTTSLLASPSKTSKSSKLTKKKTSSKITNTTKDKTPSSSKSKTRKKAPSKHRTKSTTKQSKSKTPKKKPSSSKSRTKATSSKSKTKLTPSKSKSKRTPSRSKSSKKSKSKGTKKSKKKRTKPKSNNQVDDHEIIKSSTFIYPQSYKKMYENRQRILKILLSST